MESDLTSLCKAEELGEVELVELTSTGKEKSWSDAEGQEGSGEVEPATSSDQKAQEPEPEGGEKSEESTIPPAPESAKQPSGSSSKAKKEKKDVPSNKTGSVGPVLLYSLIACIGGVLGGYSHGFPSPTLLDLEKAYERGERVNAFPSNSVYAGLFGAIGPVGGLFGGPISGPVADRIGRSGALVLMTIPHLIGWLAQAYAQWMPSLSGFIAILMLGRWFTGFATGWGSLVITIYMIEIAPAKLKGLFGSMYWFSTAVGILLVYGLGAIPGFSYSALSLSTAGLVLPCVLLYCFLPETPRWLATKQRPEEAREVMQRLRGKDTDVSAEMKELQANVAESGKQSWRSNLRYLSNRSAYKPLVLSALLMLFQQLTGSNVVVFYASTILTDARVLDASQVAGYAVGTTQVLAVFLSVLLVDFAGRKVLLVTSSALVCLSTGLLGLYYFLTDYVCPHRYHVDVSTPAPPPANLSHLPLFCEPISSSFFVLAIFSVILFIIGFSVGWSTIPWVMMSELSPLRVRGLLSGVATLVNWSTAAFVTGIFPVYQGVAQHYGSWWTLCGITALSVPFVLIFLPETKGRSLEQIEEGLKSKDKENDKVAETTL